MLGAGLEAADGDDGAVERVELAADQGLQAGDDAAGEHDRVAGGVRRGAVAADAAHDHVDAESTLARAGPSE